MFTCDPQTEVFVDRCVWCDERLDLFHEFKTEMAVLQDDPSAVNEVLVNSVLSDYFLSFAHRDLLCEFTFLLSQFIYR